MTRPRHDFEKVRSLFAEGRNNCEISRLTGVPRATVRDWRTGARDETRRSSGKNVDSCSHEFLSLPSDQYSYLLGMYLGDGYIADHGRGVFRLRIFSDVRYPGIIKECCDAIEAVMPGQKAYRLPREGCVEISMYSKHWPCLFPQHGPGRKHERAIRLTS